MAHHLFVSCCSDPIFERGGPRRHQIMDKLEVDSQPFVEAGQICAGTAYVHVLGERTQGISLSWSEMQTSVLLYPPSCPIFPSVANSPVFLVRFPVLVCHLAPADFVLFPLVRNGVPLPLPLIFRLIPNGATLLASGCRKSHPSFFF